MFHGMVTHFDKALDRMWLIQEADGAFEKEWYESIMPSASLILHEAAWRASIYNDRDWNTQVGHLKVNMRHVVGTHMFAVPWRKVSEVNVSLKINKSTVEITSQHLVAHKKALATELKNMGKDLFETAEPRKVTVTNRSHALPSSCHCLHRVQLVD